MKGWALFILLLIVTGNADAQTVLTDSLQRLCVNPKLNRIQFFQKEALLPFFTAWSGNKSVSIALFGDSHVQPDIYPGEVRKQLQAVKGEGGFGMAFPYSAARTYSAIDYFSSHTGEWLFAKSIEYKPKLPLGVSGVTSRTGDDHATLRLKFKKPLPATYTKLKIYCRQDKKSFDFVVLSGNEEVSVDVDSVLQKPIEIVFQQIDSTIELRLVKSWSYQTEFEFYGFSIENVSQEGLILHSLGIGGSRYGSLLGQKLLDEQLPTLHPDLVILDFGTNDFLYDNKIPIYLEDQIVQVIQKVRKASPGATVLLTTVQDMNRRQMNITASSDFADLIRKVAKSQQCPFYDWYWISGGPEKMTTWMENGLAQQDMIHLTMKGYTLKGRLLAEALLKSMSAFAEGTIPDSLLVNVDSLKRLRLVIPDKGPVDSAKALVPSPVNFVRHKIVRGETLKTIAKIYHVRVSDIKRTNGLQNSMIIEGNYLNIEIREPAAKNASAKRVKPRSKAPGREKFVTHKVAEGETLSELAQVYKVSVVQIQKLNGLKSTRIRTGHVLKIKPVSVPSKGR